MLSIFLHACKQLLIKKTRSCMWHKFIINYNCNQVTNYFVILLFIVPEPQLVWAVQGQDAELPCDVTPPVLGDRVNMVLWFKDNAGIPLYR
jgi:hypothetical protein